MKKIFLAIFCSIFFTLPCVAQGLGKIWKQQKERSKTMSKKGYYKRKVFFTYLDKNEKLKTVKGIGFTSPIDTVFESDNIILFEECRPGQNGAVCEMFVYRPGEKYPHYIGRRTEGSMMNPVKGMFRKLCKKYFADNSDLTDKIMANKKGYRPSNILAIVKEYDNWKNRQ